MPKETATFRTKEGGKEGRKEGRKEAISFPPFNAACVTSTSSLPAAAEVGATPRVRTKRQCASRRPHQRSGVGPLSDPGPLARSRRRRSFAQPQVCLGRGAFHPAIRSQDRDDGGPILNERGELGLVWRGRRGGGKAARAWPGPSWHLQRNLKCSE